MIGPVSQIGALATSVIQQSLLLELLDEAPALVFVADEQMRYLAVNATACRTLGYTRQELLALRVSDVATADDAEDVYAHMVETGEHSGRTSIRARDGTIRTFRYAARRCEMAGLRYYIAVGLVEPADS
jgi:PAS domain S-box-containing protein